MKDYKERKDFILRTTFWKCFVPMPKFVRKVHHKTEFCNSKNYMHLRVLPGNNILKTDCPIFSTMQVSRS